MKGTSRRRAVGRLLLSSLRGNRWRVAGLVFWSTVEAFPAFLSGRLVARAVDDGFLARDLWTGFGWLAVLALTVPVGAIGTSEAFRRLAELVEPFRDRLVERTVAGVLRRSTSPGAIPDVAGVARLTQQVEIVREAYANVLMVGQSFVVKAGGAVLGLFTLAPVTLGFVLPPLLLAIVVFGLTLRPMAGWQRTSILANEHLAESTSLIASGLRDVVAAGGEEVARASVDRHIDEHARASIVLARLTALRSLSITVGGLVPLVLLLAAGSWLLRRGLSTGALLGSLTYLLTGIHPALQSLVRQLGHTGLWLFVTAGRLVEAGGGSDEEPEASASGQPRRPSPSHATDLELRGVSFRYGPQAEPVVEGLDLTVPSGDHLAVLGPSGAGKSTLAGLMAGLLRPEAGEVRLGRVALRELDFAALCQRRVYVPQESYVFAGTLWENLTYYRPAATPQEVEDALVRFGVRPLVRRIGGLDATVQRGSLSGGERQLIALVRAYLADAPIVILDEATCHLDPATEARVERLFAERAGTLIVIAHRISSAVRARRVLVLDRGVAVEGSHQELLVASALYRSLVGHWEQPSALPA